MRFWNNKKRKKEKKKIKQLKEELQKVNLDNTFDENKILLDIDLENPKDEDKIILVIYLTCLGYYYDINNASWFNGIRNEDI